MSLTPKTYKLLNMRMLLNLVTPIPFLRPTLAIHFKLKKETPLTLAFRVGNLKFQHF